MAGLAALTLATAVVTGAVVTSLRPTPPLAPPAGAVAESSLDASPPAPTSSLFLPSATVQSTPSRSPSTTPPPYGDECTIHIPSGIAKVGEIVRIEAYGLTPGGPGEGLGSLHHDGQDVPLQFEADGTYTREFVAGAWMANRQFNVRIVDLTNDCSTETILVVESAKPTPSPGRDCYISIDHVLPRVGERFVVEAHGLTPGGHGYGLGELQSDRDDVPLTFSGDGTYRYVATAESWMLEPWHGTLIIRIRDSASNCLAQWVVEVHPADWVPDPGCWVSVTPSTGRYGDVLDLDAGGFEPNGAGDGLWEVDPGLSSALLGFDAAGELHRPLNVTWREGEGIVSINDGTCQAMTVATAVP
jgi:hypothetical protein